MVCNDNYVTGVTFSACTDCIDAAGHNKTNRLKKKESISFPVEVGYNDWDIILKKNVE